MGLSLKTIKHSCFIQTQLKANSLTTIEETLSHKVLVCCAVGTSLKNNMESLQWYDFLIFALTLLTSLGIGIYFALSGGRQGTTAEYLQGNRKLSPIPVGVSIALSVKSAILIIGGTADVYTHGAQRLIQVLAVFCGTLVALVLYAPMFYKLRITTQFQVRGNAFIPKSISYHITLYDDTNCCKNASHGEKISVNNYMLL